MSTVEQHRYDFQLLKRKTGMLLSRKITKFFRGQVLIHISDGRDFNMSREFVSHLLDLNLEAENSNIRRDQTKVAQVDEFSQKKRACKALTIAEMSDQYSQVYDQIKKETVK